MTETLKCLDGIPAKVMAVILLAVSFATSGSAGEMTLKNPFGVFNLAPFNQMPASNQVALALSSGYDGLMASMTRTNPLARLREFVAVPAVRDGRFKIYSILWQVRCDQPLDEKLQKLF